MNQEEWGMQTQPTVPMSIEAMENLIQRLKVARELYDEAKALSSAKYHELEEVEKEVMNALKSNNRSKFEAEGVALVYISTKEVYPTPKTPEAKSELFNYIQAKYGAHALTNMQSINHNTLNSWANKEVEADPTLVIPGLDAPSAVETLNFRKK